MGGTKKKRKHGKLDGPDPCKRLIVCARRIAKTFYFHAGSSQTRLEPHPLSVTKLRAVVDELHLIVNQQVVVLYRPYS